MVLIIRLALPALLLAGLAACGNGEENARPDPVNLAQFKQGAQRIDVYTAVGKPEWSLIRNGRPCDEYKLYTQGINAGGKAAMAIGEGLTDVATLGLAEIAWSGVHAGTRPRIHTVMFCYAAPPSDELVDLYDKDPSRVALAMHTVLNPGLYAQPIILPAPAPKPLPAAGNLRLAAQTQGPTVTPRPATGTEVPSQAGEGADALNEASDAQATSENAGSNAYYANHPK